MKIAVVGSGISGLFASYLLSKRHEVVLFEKRDRLGGHSHTVDVTLKGRTHPVDTGFIAYNEPNYPNFVKFLDELDVDTKASSMSFSYRDARTGVEYGGRGLNEFFVQRRNLIEVTHWQLLLDFVRFYFLVPALKHEADLDDSLGDFLELHNFSSVFVEEYLIPMVSAIWSVPLKTAREFPFSCVADFFEDHGLLKLRNRPGWRTIEGGSREYIRAFEEAFDGEVKTDHTVDSVDRDQFGVTVHAEWSIERFDAVVLATHSDQARRLLENPTEREESILGAIDYERNQVILHTDRSLLPENESIWASWNYHRNDTSGEKTTVTYNLSILQDLPFNQPVCLSLNAEDQVASSAVLDRFTYEHPIFSAESLEARRRKDEIDGEKNAYYAGAYWGDGFHEAGMESALSAVRELGVEWTA